MDAEERGCRTDAAAVGDVVFLPRLCDLLSLRWYSIGDWRAAAEKRRRQKASQLNLETEIFSPRTVEEVPLSL